jgi:hypothetical protein
MRFLFPFPFPLLTIQKRKKKNENKQTLTTEAMSGGGHTQQLRESAGGAGGLGDLPCEILTHILSYATPPAATIPLEVDPPHKLSLFAVRERGEGELQ